LEVAVESDKIRERVYVSGTRIGIEVLSSPRLSLVMSRDEALAVADELVNKVSIADANFREVTADTLTAPLRTRVVVKEKEKPGRKKRKKIGDKKNRSD
jgi:hypothetical protein